MQPVYTFLATLLPKPGDTPAGCFHRSVRRVTDWVAAAYPESANFTVRPDGVPAHPAPDNEVVAVREAIDPGHELFTLDWSQPGGDDGGRLLYSVELARVPLGIQTRVAVRAAAGRFAVAPVRFDPFRPPVVDFLCEEAAALVGGVEPVPTAVRRLTPPFVPGFVDDLLLAPHRALPVVVMSPLPHTGRPVVDPEAVLEQVFGLAHVVELSVPASTFALTNRLGKEWSCFLGAVRVYWPGLAPDQDNFRRHPIFFPDHYDAGPDADRRLPLDILRRVASAAHVRFADAPLVRVARAALDKKRQAAVQKQLADLTAGAEESREWLRQLETALREGQKLKDDLELTRLELADVRETLAAQQEQWATVDAEIASARHAADAAKAGVDGLRRFAQDRVKRVTDAIELARAEFPATLLFLPDAVKSAADSPYQQPRKVYELFRALDDVMRVIRARGSLGEPLYDMLRRHGFEYKDKISLTSEGKYGDEYRFVYNGGKTLFENHVTIGASHNPQDCLSVHWFRDEPAGRFVIGWCGKHRTNTKT